MSFMLLGILNSQASGGEFVTNFDLLATTQLTSSATSISLTGLNTYTDYDHLQLRVSATVNNTSNSVNSVSVRVNGDSGSNYSHYAAIADGSSVQDAYNYNTSSFSIEKTLVGQSATNLNKFGSLILDFYDFRNTSKKTNFRGIGGNVANEARVALYGGVWNNTSAITSLQVVELADIGFGIGTRVSLYGYKGAV